MHVVRQGLTCRTRRGRGNARVWHDCDAGDGRIWDDPITPQPRRVTRQRMGQQQVKMYNMCHVFLGLRHTIQSVSGHKNIRNNAGAGATTATAAPPRRARGAAPVRRRGTHERGRPVGQRRRAREHRRVRLRLARRRRSRPPAAASTAGERAPRRRCRQRVPRACRRRC